MKAYYSFQQAIREITGQLLNAGRVHTAHWQGMDISKRPEAEMLEMLNQVFQVPLVEEDLEYWRQDIKPNLPWADDHFAERVGGLPLNPGEQWKNWPWSNSADKFRTQGEAFDHTYMERFWPKYAGATPGGHVDTADSNINPIRYPSRGIRFLYADLNDLVIHLADDPLSRQAYLPIWFPEDGAPEAKRKPCTLGYWFIRRGDQLHMHYPIRSCDITRHFRDDCYMAVRLLLWILDRLRERDPNTWNTTRPGAYSMWIGSLHCFIGDRLVLRKWLER